SVLIYATPDSMPDVAEWTAYTNLGELRFEGLFLDSYLDHELIAYVRDSALIHVLEDKGQDVEYRNVWILDGDEESLRVYLGDIERTIALKKKTNHVEEMFGSLADLGMKGGKIARISLKQDIITGKVLSVQADAVEIEGYGLVSLDEECKVLKTYGEVRRESLSDILVGYDMQQFVVAEGKICAVLTVRAFEADTIRVLLMTSGFSNMFHDSVTLVSDGAMTLTQVDESEAVEAGQELTFVSGDERLAAGRVILEPENDAEIRVPSLERSLGTPSYGGRLEILDTELGLVLINDLYLEDYLRKVVPSEMPSTYEIEALKAQAVCARTYAYMQIQSNTYSRYGAHVDDSTNFQVYNNVETDARTAQAVQETYGKMLLYDGSPVSAYYFSTSCGVTSDLGVWGGDPEETPYLKSVFLQPGGGTPDLTDNDVFASFIKDPDYPAFDSSYPLYRWSMVTNVNYLTDHIDGVGTVESVQITERGAGGVAQNMLVKGTDGEKTISGQSAIRAALADPALTLVRGDGKSTDGWSSLPSGFLTIEEYGVNSSGVKRYKIYGGGYGHGVGMSQNGAQGMAKAGYSCEEILNFFYSGVTVDEID
ncbi:MAG: SpoIID/LytB domain-containing protein, partial [Clostridiales bacterium]|nr:SpoIID/LytB domain-containing protein [Clostridiales bacterium]